MAPADDPHRLPADLPRPGADGACDHLPGRQLPALALPATAGATFEVEGQILIRRLSLIVSAGRIEHVFYPVFPSDANAADVVAWLQAHPRRPGTRS